MRTGLFRAALHACQKSPRLGKLCLNLAARVLPGDTPHWGLTQISNELDHRLLAPAKLVNGMKMQVVWTDSVGSAIRAKGCFEPEVVSVFLSRLKSRDTVIDVGAHVGQYTLLAAGIGCTVHSFEPDPRTFATLSANVYKNRLAGVFLNQCALADASRSASLFSARSENIGATSLLPNNDTADSFTTVSCLTLDGYGLECGNPEISLVKIDVEGAELDVLRGSKSLLSRCHPMLILEFFESRQSAFGHSCSDIADFLRAFGYRLWRITPTGLVPYVVQELEERYFNVFAE